MISACSNVSVLTDCELFCGLSADQDVLLTHGDSIEELAECCQAVAHSGSLIAAIQHKTLKVYGLQFHPEVDLTDNGADMMRNFLYNVRQKEEVHRTESKGCELTNYLSSNL